MKKMIYILFILFGILSCANDDEPVITVDIQEGILGQWHVENECDNRTHIFEFIEGGVFKYHFMDNINTGTYSLSGRDLVTRGFNFIGEGENSYKIMVLTSDRLELDNKADFGVDYRFVRICE